MMTDQHDSHSNGPTDGILTKGARLSAHVRLGNLACCNPSKVKEFMANLSGNEMHAETVNFRIVGRSLRPVSWITNGETCLQRTIP
jgi:hypothetical protein